MPLSKKEYNAICSEIFDSNNPAQISLEFILKILQNYLSPTAKVIDMIDHFFDKGLLTLKQHEMCIAVLEEFDAAKNT